MASLEASTFVKRFKAASKEQLKIAKNIDQQTLDAFGVEDAPVQQASFIAGDAKKQSDVVRVIQSDLDAYFQRKQDARFKATLDEMRKTDIVHALSGDGDKVSTNLSGQGMTGSEYWADTLDRWAEEMVAASDCKASSSCSADSLPPEIVLKVMQSLRDEMKLRDETREEENAKPALDPTKYASDAQGLGNNQTDISNHTAGAITDILALPDGANKFGKDIGLLKQVVEGDERIARHSRDARNRCACHRRGDRSYRAAAQIEALRQQGRRWWRLESRRRQRSGPVQPGGPRRHGPRR